MSDEQEFKSTLELALDIAYAAGRKAGLEEAAKRADDEANDYENAATVRGYDAPACRVRAWIWRELADELRALAEKEKS